MSIEQKIAKLLEESQKLQQEEGKLAEEGLSEEQYNALSEEEQAEYTLIDEASKATDAGLQTRMDKNFTKSVATRYDGTRKQEAEGKKAMVKTAKIIKSRGGDAAAAKQKASDKNDYENEMM